MAKIVQKDAGKRYQEDLDRSAIETEASQRERYVEDLKNSEEFQRFVVAPIEKTITDMADVRKFPSGSVEDLAKLTFHTKLALNVIEKFIGPFRK